MPLRDVPLFGVPFLGQKINSRVPFLVKSHIGMKFGISVKIDNSLGHCFQSNFTYLVYILDCCHNFRIYFLNGL